MTVEQLQAVASLLGLWAAVATGWLARHLWQSHRARRVRTRRREAVDRLIAWADTLAEGTSGDYKRHLVLARLQKQFPEARTRELALDIEVAIQERG
jgi:hypothetical protein